jgi:hypothetical protein
MVSSQAEYNALKTDEEKVAALEVLREGAQQMGASKADLSHYDQMAKCMVCKKYVFFCEDEYSRIEGHIHSWMGQKEMGISGCCEYCFDKMFAEPDEDELTEQEVAIEEARERGE